MQSSSKLRYVSAREIGNEVVDFSGLDVRGQDNDKLGDVDGFIVDVDGQRAYYVVVDSGGWFTSRKFLVPVGHARVDAAREALILDVSRDTVSRYPEYDQDAFAHYGEEERRSYERRYAEACCPEDALDDGAWDYDRSTHYRQPQWWPSRAAAVDTPAAVGTTGRPVDTRSDARDVSPHLDGRAQPGDVLGIETGGETTEIGDTGEDEDKRRKAAEKDARERRD
jgi:hypothetical protein